VDRLDKELTEQYK